MRQDERWTLRIARIDILLERPDANAAGNAHDIEGEQQDERLRAIESSMFFQMLRRHTIEGMFCDPLHGGNAGMIGWQLIGYPGPLMSYREQIGKQDGTAWKRKPVSLSDQLGHPVSGWEEER